MCLFRIDSNTLVSILYQFGVYKLFFFPLFKRLFHAGYRDCYYYYYYVLDCAVFSWTIFSVVSFLPLIFH